MEEGRTQSEPLWSTFDLSFSAEDGGINFAIKLIKYFKMKSVSISSHFPRKNTITFCNIWDIFTRKQGGVTSQRVRIKIWQILFHPHDFWSTSC